MEFKGTKGEWYAQGEEYPAIESRERGVVITHPTIANVVSIFRSKEEYTANAKLIACAPDTIANLNISNEMLISVLSLFGENMSLTTKFGIVSQIEANDELIKKATTI